MGLQRWYWRRKACCCVLKKGQLPCVGVPLEICIERRASSMITWKTSVVRAERALLENSSWYQRIATTLRFFEVRRCQDCIGPRSCSSSPAHQYQQAPPPNANGRIPTVFSNAQTKFERTSLRKFGTEKFHFGRRENFAELPFLSFTFLTAEAADHFFLFLLPASLPGFTSTSLQEVGIEVIARYRRTMNSE